MVAVLVLPLPTQARLVIFPFRKLGPLVHLWAGKACRGATCCWGAGKFSAWGPWLWAAGKDQSLPVQWL